MILTYLCILRRRFFGPSGWVLGWEAGLKAWQISNPRHPGVTASVAGAGAGYPVHIYHS